ncbi:MBL fold metallo-hydrolase [Halosimplex sp. J119]
MVTQLREGVWWIDLRGTNAYLVDDGGDLTLVDAGMPWQGGDVVTAVAEAGFALDDLDRVFVTHFDVDHVGGLARFDGLDVPIYVGQRDAGLVAGRTSPPLRFPKGGFQRAMGLLYTPPDNDVVPLADGDTVGSFTAYETPGHTPGHVAYVSEELGVALLGDLAMESDGELRPSPWFLSSDTDHNRASVRRLADESPNFEVAAIGHGVPFERGGADRFADLAASLGHARESAPVRQ